MQMLKDWLKILQYSTDLENRRVILRLIESNKSEPVRLLDLGCGDGSFTLELGREIGTTQLYGVEIEDEYIQQCEAKGIKAYYGDLNEPLPLDSDSFDIVVANQVLEHLHRTDLFIREVHRVLRRGGYAVISTPNLAAWHNVFFLLWGWQPLVVMISDEVNVGNPLHRHGMKAVVGKYPTHRRIATPNALKELFQYHGFEVEKIVCVGYYPFPVNIARVFSRLDPRHAVYLTVKARKV